MGLETGPPMARITNYLSRYCLQIANHDAGRREDGVMGEIPKAITITRPKL